INSFSIGVNDTTTYVTRADFDTKISTIELQLASIDQKIAASIINYLTQNAPWFDGSATVNITKNQTSNRYTLITTAPVYCGLVGSAPSSCLTLSMFNWQWANTAYSTILQVNTDCLLSVSMPILNMKNSGSNSVRLFRNDSDTLCRYQWGTDIAGGSNPTGGLSFTDYPFGTNDTMSILSNQTNNCFFNVNDINITVKPR
ncbi:MAG: hypothetical protein Q4F88_06700, partial [Eubacteriales bacterium]|nr:hypothetical protein [Eubacteriales bacterium]